MQQKIHAPGIPGPDAPAEGSTCEASLQLLEEQERGPIHFPGGVQPHAVLVGAVACEGTLVVRYLSDNVERLLGFAPQALLRRPLSDLLTQESLEVVTEPNEDQRPFTPHIIRVRTFEGAKAFAGSFHWYEDVLLVELEAADTDGSQVADLGVSESAVFNRVLKEADDSASLEEYAQSLAACLRDISGYDRVMVYRFSDEGHGEVIAESKLPQLETFLGMHCLASDMPWAARRLCVISRCHVIADVRAPAASIISDDPVHDSLSLDLRFSVARADSPSHGLLPQDTEVAATMAMSLVHDGRLWGLAVFHHYTQRHCTPRLRALVHELSDTCSMLLGFLQKRQSDRLQSASRELENLLSVSLQQDDPTHSLIETLPAIRRIVDADGIIVKLAGTPALKEGIVPDPARFGEAVTGHPTLRGFTDFVSTNLAKNLPRIHQLEPSLSGLYFQAMTDDLEAYVVWFRQEREVTANRAGRKEANEPARDGHPQPQRAFREWGGSAGGESQPWSEDEIFAMKQVKSMLLRFQLRIRDAQLARLGQFDALTQLPNRVMFLQHLASRVERAQKRGDRFSIMFVDLDRFKTINDSLGHAMGDRILVEIAKRLRGLSHHRLFVARLGGDEFTILLDEVYEGVVESTAQEIVMDFREPVTVDAFNFHVPVSVGVAHFERGATIEHLMRDADSAMYTAKAQGGNRFCVSSPQIRSDASERLDLEQSLHDAVERGEIHTFFQPIVKAGSREVVALESLLRWQRPSGMVPPGKFLDIAESTGLILPVGQELIRQTFRFAERVIRRIGPAISFNINLSAMQLLDDGTFALLLERLALSKVPAANICIEVTEQSHIVEEANAYTRLSEIRERGMKVALDDFGAGYSSISYLQTLPIDIVKFDRAFLLNLRSQSRPQEMLRACRNLADACGLESVVEGIETKEHTRLLDGIGFDYYQGYLFGRPMAPECILAYLTDLDD